MRILIISSPRCGSSALTRGLSKALGYKEYQEPYNKFWGTKYYGKDADYFEDNCVVKLIAYEKSPSYKGDTLSFLLSLINQFDRVLFLDRKDFNAQLESYSFMRKHRYDGDWQAKYIYNKDTDLNVDNYYLSLLKDVVIFLANQSKKPVIYYEDIFSDNPELVEATLKKSGVNVEYEDLRSYIDTKRKLRVNKEDINLI